MDQDRFFQLLIKEIEIVEANIARFDQNGLKLKSWCVTIWSVLLAFGIERKELLVIIVAGIVIFCFGFIELAYRRFQRRFIVRSEEIEKMINKDKNIIANYKYSVNRAACTVNRREEIMFVFSQPHFKIFYLILFLLTILCVIFLKASV